MPAYRLVFKYSGLIVAIFFIGFIADCFNAYLIQVQDEYNPISIIVRGSTLFILILLLLKKASFNSLIVPGYLLITNIIGSIIIFLLDSDFTVGGVVKHIYIASKFLYVFVLYGIVHTYFNSEENANKLFVFFEFSFFIYCSSIFLGLAFSIDEFQSYRQNLRFGYKGLIVTVNEAVGLFMMAIYYFHLKYRITKYLRYEFACIAMLISSCLVGSKAGIVFGLLGFVLVHISDVRHFIRGYSTALFFSIFALLLIYREEVKVLFDGTISYISYFLNKGDSLLSVLVTGRDIRAANAYVELTTNSSYSVYNYLFGGFRFDKIYSEMDVIDVYGLFGLFGAFVYLFFYICNFLLISKVSIYSMSFLLLFLSCAALGGHLLYNAVLPVYLVVFALMLNRFSREVAK